jgi:hypothetical protein
LNTTVNNQCLAMEANSTRGFNREVTRKDIIALATAKTLPDSWSGNGSGSVLISAGASMFGLSWSRNRGDRNAAQDQCRLATL